MTPTNLFLFSTLLFLPLTSARLPDAPPDCVGGEFKFPIISLPDPKPFTGKELEEGRKAALKRHNCYRSLHGAPPMTLDDALNTRAQHAAECNVKWSRMQHTGNDGENVAYAWSESDTRFDPVEEAVAAVDSWYSEYCFGTQDDNSDPAKGHFTQVVWKSSTKLGIGIAASAWNSTSKSVYTAGRYLPPGNYDSKTSLAKEVLKLSIPDKEICLSRGGSDEEVKLSKYCDGWKDGGNGANLPISNVVG